MNQNNGMQKRMLVMTLVVFVFFIAYESLEKSKSYIGMYH